MACGVVVVQGCCRWCIVGGSMVGHGALSKYLFYVSLLCCRCRVAWVCCCLMYSHLRPAVVFVRFCVQACRFVSGCRGEEREEAPALLGGAWSCRLISILHPPFRSGHVDTDLQQARPFRVRATTALCNSGTGHSFICHGAPGLPFPLPAQSQSLSSRHIHAHEHRFIIIVGSWISSHLHILRL